MKKKLLTVVLALAVMFCMSMPAAADTTSGTAAQALPATLPTVTVNKNVSKTYADSTLNTSVPGTTTDYYGKIKVAKSGVLTISNFESAEMTLSSNQAFTLVKKNYGSEGEGIWKVSKGTYYIKEVVSDPLSESSVKVTALFGVTKNMNLLKSSDRKLLYGYGVKGTKYFKFKPKKTGCYITGAYAVCNIHKKVISAKGNGVAVGLIKGKVYYLKMYNKKTEYLNVAAAVPYKIKKENSFRNSFSKAKKLKAIVVPTGTKEHATMAVEYYVASGSNTLWVKFKMPAAGTLNIKSSNYGMMNSAGVCVCNAKGKAVTKYVTGKREKTISKTLKAGTYYAKFKRTSKKHSGKSVVYMSFGPINFGG